LQRREPVQRIGALCLERCDGGAGGSGDRRDLRNFQRRHLAGSQLLAHQSDRTILRRSDLARGGDGAGRSAQVDIGQHGIGDDRDAQSVDDGRLRLGISARGGRGRAKPTEQVEIPARGRGDIVIRRRHIARRARLSGGIVDAKRALDGRLRQSRRLCLAQGPARTVEIGIGDP
jgi:hypothetical protein